VKQHEFQNVRSATREAPSVRGAEVSPLPLSDGRIAIEAVRPEINGGRFFAKATQAVDFLVSADIYCDGHDVLRAAVLVSWGKASTEIPMRPIGNDRWEGTVNIPDVGPCSFTIIAWRDLFASWAAETTKKIAAYQRIALDAIEGRNLIEAALGAGTGQEASRLLLEDVLARMKVCPDEDECELLLSDNVLKAMSHLGSRADLTRYENDVPVFVERALAGFGSWYELFPRSQSAVSGRHGTFDDVIKQLSYVRQLGFDVLYFPPIHPIGRTNRKGPNNSLVAAESDPGSPYAIGAADGGHTAIHSELGTLADFDRLVDAARDKGLEIALDFAIQCSPDHPWVKQHPEWFNRRPDGSIKFAENPPKKYEDIVNVDFYGEGKQAVWTSLRDVVQFWIEHGVTIFRVDNPHTKPFPFWEWLINDIRRNHPEVIFLAEAFTRPKVMGRLAKIGFSQSYSYFTWRNEKGELQAYLSQLTQGEERWYMRPNFFANTPDINPYFLQNSGRAGFQIRLVLAATLGGSYGIYSGFEICEAAAVPGKEEYLDSEKYQIRHRDLNSSGNIAEDIIFINRLRKEHAALRAYSSLRFYNAWNDHILYYGKMDAREDSFLLFHVNLDPHNAHEFQFEVPLWEFGLSDEASVEVEDLVHGNRFTWHGKLHTLRIDPATVPYAIWRIFPPGVRR
jgi:starch synthase (maltosyl-transferring)